MAEGSEDKVKVELELPADEVNVEPEPAVLKRAQKVKNAQEQVQKKMEEIEKKEEKLKEKEEKLEKKAEESKEEGEGEEKTVAGYKVSELAKAPAEPPEPEDKKAPNQNQKVIMGCGGLMIIIGAFLWPIVSLGVGLFVMVIGALVVGFGVLVRL